LIGPSSTQGVSIRSWRRSKEGERAPFAKRRAGDELAAMPAPAPDWRHVGLGPGLVDENEPLRIKPPLIFLSLLALPGDCRPRLLGGKQRFLS
jgi:hypothetical protein